MKTIATLLTCCALTFAACGPEDTDRTDAGALPDPAVDAGQRGVVMVPGDAETVDAAADWASPVDVPLAGRAGMPREASSALVQLSFCLDVFSSDAADVWLGGPDTDPAKATHYPVDVKCEDGRVTDQLWVTLNENQSLTFSLRPVPSWSNTTVIYGVRLLGWSVP